MLSKNAQKKTPQQLAVQAAEMLAVEHAAFMIGVALGRRLGPLPMKGGA